MESLSFVSSLVIPTLFPFTILCSGQSGHSMTRAHSEKHVQKESERERESKLISPSVHECFDGRQLSRRASIHSMHNVA